jgi:hypothetical protein
MISTTGFNVAKGNMDIKSFNVVEKNTNVGTL